jgi:secondary thiamine-phosphate synthase enzyme
MIRTTELEIPSEGGFFALNITDRVQDLVAASSIREGIVHVFYKHTTGTILVIEHEVGILVDLEDMLERLLPNSGEYHHHLRGYDSNGSAHLRTALLGVSVTLPIVDSKLHLGSYQEILMIDMDPGQKSRTVVVQVIGEQG